jgi:hypothetical protein
MAADDSSDSGASYVHLRLSVSGSASEVTPVNCALPRNCGHEAG